jgi:phosphatidylinositol-3-phosphatase
VACRHCLGCRRVCLVGLVAGAVLLASCSSTSSSLLIVTADEDDNGHEDNRIPTLLVGAHLRPVESATRVDQYSVLRTLLASFEIPPFGEAASSRSIAGVWIR